LNKLDAKNFRAKMFNRRASDPKSRPDEILETLALRSGQNIADIGAGGGYFSLRFAEAVKPGGKVYAVDTNEQFLNFLRSEARERGLSNIEPVLVTEGSLSLPEGGLDLVFMRNAYHHLTDRVQYLTRLACLLKPCGRVAIVEYRRAALFSFRGLFKHYVPQERIVDEMEKAGYRLDGVFGFLPEQSFTIFSVKG
jgi:ubiquinone/menaquinone biosynthesis C-methylase UbiE